MHALIPLTSPPGYQNENGLPTLHTASAGSIPAEALGGGSTNRKDRIATSAIDGISPVAYG